MATTTTTPRVREIPLRYFHAVLALATVLAVLAIGARTATAAVTHHRLQVAMARYGTCRSGSPVTSGESATEGGAVLYADLFGSGPITRRPILQVYAGDQRQDPDGRHVTWTTRHGVREILAGFSHLRQVAGILDRLRSGMSCR
jgi:hypothetical protein